MTAHSNQSGQRTIPRFLEGTDIGVHWMPFFSLYVRASTLVWQIAYGTMIVQWLSPVDRFKLG